MKWRTAAKMKIEQRKANRGSSPQLGKPSSPQPQGSPEPDETELEADGEDENHEAVHPRSNPNEGHV